jgi:uncharacterized protein (DUF58 family)
MLKLPTPSRLTTLDELLRPELAARLSQLDITSRKVFSGKLKGERRSKRRGESVEFADHRPYVTGDDLRHIDWNIFGRLDRMFIKLFLEEEDLSLHIIVDCSLSMDTGNPSKFIFAQKLAAAMGYIGLVNLNRVAISALGERPGSESLAIDADQSDAPQPPQGLVSSLRDLRGRRRLQDLSAYLLQLEPSGGTRFTDACKRIAISRRGRGVMLIISDFLVKEGYDTGLRLLKGNGYDLFALQVLSPQELEPDKPGGPAGDLRLKDLEDSDLAEVTITAPLIKKYKQILNAYCNRLHEFCVQRDIIHMTVRSDTPLDTLVVDTLRRRGLLR